MIRKIYILILCFLLPYIRTFSSDIENLGIPFITNYNRSDYQSGNQNWCITQDQNNVVWFGNTAFILWFDGKNWGRVPINNSSIVRSLLTTTHNRVLLGAFEELGSIERDTKGNFFYRSWVDKIPVNYRNFSDIWNIYEINGEIYFQSPQFVFVFKDETFQRVIVPENIFHYSYMCNNRFYILDKNIGLKVLIQDELVLLEEGDFFSDKEVWFLEYNRGHLIAGTQKEGLYIFKNGKWSEWNNATNKLLKKYSLYSGVKTQNGDFIFGTVQNGLLFCDQDGNINKIVNKKKGLNNNTVLSMMIDKEENLWLGLDQGISYLKINSPFLKLVNEDGLGTGYASALYKDYLYLGTNQGLYAYKFPTQPTKDFKLIPGSEGQVWDLQVLNDRLFCSHHNGLFLVNDDKLRLIAPIEGCWKVMEIPRKKDQYIVGTYNGLWHLYINNNSFEVKKLEGFSQSCRIMEFDKNNTLWMSHGYKGIYQFIFDTDFRKIDKLLFYGTAKGLPSEVNNELFKVDDKITIATISGFYQYNELLNKMEPFEKWNRLLPFSNTVSKVIQDDWNRFYFYSGGALSNVIFSRDSLLLFDNSTFLSLQNEFFPAFENITFISQNLSLLSTVGGFVLYDRDIGYYKGFKLPLFIKSFICNEKNTFETISDTIPFAVNDIAIPYRWNNLQIEIGTPYFQNPSNIRITKTLNGELINNPVTESGVIELNDLKEGNYTLSLTVSDISKRHYPNMLNLDFEILPPWYRTWYAIILYLIVLSLFTYSILIFVRHKIARIRRREQIMQKRKMIQHQISLKQKALRAEQEMIKLRNENLQNENRSKAEEIANSTMELVQKNKILLMVKDKLKSIQKENNIDVRNNIIRSMLKSIDRDLNNDEKWKIFEKNFDEVHENFLNRFKDKHPNITAKDMRLCAYLRMNLSSKEIAPLLRISVRSVEISRYRLRRKLNLPHDTNLLDYILHF